MGLYKNGVKLGQPYKNGVKMNAYRNGVKMFNDGPPPPFEGFGMVVNSGSDSKFILPLRYGSGTARHDLTITWGDGTVQTTTGTAEITEPYEGLTHSYPVANKNYTIRIIGTTYLTTPENNSYFGLGFYDGFGYNAAENKVKIKALLGSLDSLIALSMPSKEYCYSLMFYNCTNLMKIPATLLPATTLATGCYNQMFSGCIGLTEAPEGLLPATKMEASCYGSMFYNCTNLMKIPVTLPATTLNRNCYNQMFSGCTGITEIPATLLPAVNLADYCYQSMFYNCTNLTEIPATLLPAITMKTNCYTAMFSGCTGLIFIYMMPDWFTGKTKQAAMFGNCANIIANTPYADIPSGWK
jgi:hypothetical protein